MSAEDSAMAAWAAFDIARENRAKALKAALNAKATKHPAAIAHLEKCEKAVRDAMAALNAAGHEIKREIQRDNSGRAY